MKLFRNLLLGITITLSGMVTSAQDLTIPADPKPEGLDFVQRTLVIQYTGIYCPNCPSMIKAIEGLVEDESYSNKYCLIINHGYLPGNPLYPTGPNDGGDNLYVLYLPDNYPRALVGQTEKFDYGSTSALENAIDKCLEREVKAGISVNSKLQDNTLKIKAQLKAVETGEYALNYCLLEDGIEESQAGLGKMIHNNVVRYTQYPPGVELGTINAGETADITIDIPLKSTWKKENCHLVLWACNSFSKDYKYGIVTNAIKAPLNTAVPYEYKTPGAIGEVEANDKIQVIALGDQVDIIASSPIEKVAVYNMQGRLMLQLSPNTKNALLSLSDLPAGVYMVRAQNATCVKTEKIIKQ